MPNHFDMVFLSHHFTFFLTIICQNYHAKSNQPYLLIWPVELALPIPKHKNFITKRSDTSMQTQRNCASYNSVGSHDLASAGLYQSTNYNINTDVNDNDDTHSFETSRKDNCSSSSFGDTITATTTYGALKKVVVSKHKCERPRQIFILD